MPRQLRNFIQGVRQVLVLDPEAQYRWPRRGDFAKDMQHLRKDATRISRDLHSTTRKYGEPIQKG